MPAVSCPTPPSLPSGLLVEGRVGHRASRPSPPWGWNPAWPSLPLVLRTGGWPKRWGQKGRWQFRGLYPPPVWKGGGPQGQARTGLEGIA